MPDESQLPLKPVADAAAVPGPNLREERERLRHRFFRANTAVAVILVAVLGLALTAILAGSDAARHRSRAVRAEQQAREQLYQSYLAQARALHLSGRMGRRVEGLKAVAAATSIRSSLELRNEAIALLAMFDLEETTNFWPVEPHSINHGFDSALQHYAIGASDRSVIVFRIADRQEVFRLRAAEAGLPEEQGECAAFQFSPDNRFLGARYQGGAVVLWELATRQALFRSSLKLTSYNGRDLEFSPDSRYLAFADLANDNLLTLVDTATGQIARTFPELPSRLMISFQPGRPVMALRVGPEVQLWNWQTGERLQSLTHPARVRRTTWSHSGQWLVAACDNGDLHRWDIRSGQARVLAGHTATPWAMIFSPSDDLFSSIALDGTCRIWEPASGRLMVTCTRGYAVGFSADGGSVAFERPSREIGFWRLERGTGLRTFSVHDAGAYLVRGMDLDPGGRWLAAVSDQGLHLWDEPAKKSVLFTPMKDLWGVDFVEEGTALFLTHSNRLTYRVLRPPTSTNDLPSLGAEESLPLPTGLVPLTCSFSADGQRAVVWGRDGRMVVVNRTAPGWTWLRRDAQSEPLPGISSLPGARRAVLSADGRWAASGGHIEGATVWDATTGQVVRELSGVTGTATFSPDARLLLVGGYFEYELWDVASGVRRHRIPRRGDPVAMGAGAISDRRGLVASVDPNQSIRLTALASGEELASLTAPDSQTVAGLRFNGDGTVLAAATGQGMIHVWRLPELRDALVRLGLDWSHRPAQSAAALGAAAGPTSARLERARFTTDPVSLTLLGLIGAGVAGFFALVVLRRHRRLAQEFIQTEGLALQRERELRVEREVSRIKSSFVSMVSHEFRTPLGIILSSADILKRYFTRLSDDRRNEHLGDIMESVGRMKDLMEGVLLLSRVDSGRMECRPIALDLPALCQRVLGEVAAAAPAPGPMELKAAVTGQARLDEGLVHIILTNLLSNALKYSPAGRPVRLTVRREGAEAVLEVSDDGIGIPVEDQAELFKSFHRARNVGAVPGTGLGLTIVKRCVELHLGTISFASAEGKGTTVVVRLPAFAA